MSLLLNIFNENELESLFNEIIYECHICYEKNVNKMNLKCNHYFCLTCSKKWFLINKNLSCPLCRLNIDKCELKYLKLLTSKIIYNEVSDI